MNLKKIFTLIWKQKWRFLAYLFWVTLFIVLLFPINQTHFFTSLQIYQKSGKSMLVLFDKIEIQLFPPTFEVQNLQVSSPLLNDQLNVGSILLKPFLDLFVKQTVTGQVAFDDLFKGHGQITMTSGPKTPETGLSTHKISFTAENIELSEISKIASLSVPLDGKIKLDLEGLIEPSFNQQPDLDVVIDLKNFNVYSAEINTAMGPLNIPGFELTTGRIKARLSAGKLIISEMALGTEPDPLILKGQGFINLTLENKQGKITPRFSNYQFELNLKASDTIIAKAGLFLALLDNYKTPLSSASRYKFKISGNSFMAPPSITP